MLTSSPELRLKQSVEELADQDNGKGEDSNGSSNGKSTHHHQGELQIQQQLQQQQQPQRPTLEETVDSLLKRLKEKRQALGLPENMLVSERASVTLPSVATVCLVRLCVVALPWLCVCVCACLCFVSVCVVSVIIISSHHLRSKKTHISLICRRWRMGRWPWRKWPCRSAYCTSKVYTVAP